MQTYIALGKWTPQGIKAIKEHPDRVARAHKMFHAAGGQLQSVYMTMGPYDIVGVCQAPDDETMARLMLTLTRHGNVRFETLKAFTEQEQSALVASLTT